MLGRLKGVVALIVGVPVVALILGGIVFVFVVLPDSCGNTVVERLASPDGRREAVLFERNCGATTGFSTQVSVLRNGRRLANERGNVFVASTNGGPYGAWGGPLVRLTWDGVKVLRLHHASSATIHRAERLVDEVRVEYEVE